VGAILVVAEHRDGKLEPTTLELIQLGRDLDRNLGRGMEAVLLGSEVGDLADELSKYVDVTVVDHPALEHYSPGGYVQGIHAFAQDSDGPPIITLLSHSSQGFDLAPALACSDKSLSLVSNCVDLVDNGVSHWSAIRKILNDKIVVSIGVEYPFVATIRPGAVKPAAALPAPGSIKRIGAQIDVSKLGAQFVRYERPEVKDIDIAAADVVVSAGRGIQKKENLRIVEDLAKALGGVVGASRPLTDMEWLPKTRQVGQSGKTVRPKLYIACGISGAMQHIAGMKDAGLILAINTDPTAPIFEVAHYGVVANVLELLPAVIKELKGG